MSDLELSKRLSSVHETPSKSSREESLASSRVGSKNESKNVSIAGTPTVISSRASICKDPEPDSAVDKSNDVDPLTSPTSPVQIPSEVSIYL